MTKPVFKSNPYDQISLFPEDILARIDPNHPVRLISKVVDELDIKFLIDTYKGGGASSYHPRLLLKILFYSYFNNICSSRKIAKALGENIYFIWLAGGARPDFRTISDFRADRLAEFIDKTFSQIVTMLVELGHVSLETQYVDGTKIESVACKYSFVWRKSVVKNKEKLEEKVYQFLSQISEEQRLEDELHEEAPQPIDNEKLTKLMTQVNKALNSPALSKDDQKKLKELHKNMLPKLAEYNAKLEKLGDRNSYSKTDEDATFMRTKEDVLQNGQLKPCYNVQISTNEQIITHFSVHQTPADTTTLISHLESFEEQYDVQSTEIVADAGYGSEENYEFMESNNIEAYVKSNQFDNEQKAATKDNPFLVQNLFYNEEQDFFVCPMGQRLQKIEEDTRKSTNGYTSHVTRYRAANCEGCPLRVGCFKSRGNRQIEVNHRLNELRTQAHKRLRSEVGQAHRRKRSIEPESVFGQLKHNHGFRRFTLKGLKKTNLEFGLKAIGHNLRKMVSKILTNGNNPFDSGKKGLLGSFFDLFLNIFHFRKQTHVTYWYMIEKRQSLALYIRYI